MSILLQNNILKATEQKIESQLTPQNRQNYLKIVVAGLKVGMQNGPNGILAALKNSKDPIGDAAKGAVNLMLLLSNQAHGTMPIQAAVPAAMSLMLQALDFVDKTGTMKIGQPELVQATHIFSNFLFKQLKITPQMLSAATQKVHGIMQDPQKMQQLRAHANIDQHMNPAASPEAPNGV